VLSPSGVPVSTLRFYEEKGLIKSIGRKGLRRIFNPSVMEQLAFISLGRQAHFSLQEMTKMFSSDGKPKIDKKKLLVKTAELDHQIKELQAVRNGLFHAANCPAPSHIECPTFRRLLKVAGAALAKGKLKK